MIWPLLLAPLAPAVAGSLILTRRSGFRAERQVRTLALVGTGLALVLTSVAIWEPGSIALTLAPGMVLRWSLDALGSLFAGLTSLLWVLAVIYSLGYATPGKMGNVRFFGFFALSQAAVLGIAMSANLLTLYVCYEALTLLTYPLVAHKGNDEALSAGRSYMLYSFGGAGLILIGLVTLQARYGELTFTSGGVLADAPGALLAAMLLLLVLGFGVKAALMPLHGWLPRAMVAPTPVSALLHAVAVVKSGLFGIVRVTFGLFGPVLLTTLEVMPVIVIMSLVTILAASWIALRQDMIKKRLAYSTVSQLAYVTLGVALLHPIGLHGALVHLVTHAVLKLILFLVAGVIMTQIGVDRVSDLNGIGLRLPVTMACFTVASLGMVGVLPTPGFWGKWQLLAASLQSGQPVAAAVLVLSAVLAAVYLLPISVSAFFQSGRHERPDGPEAPASMLVPIVILTAVGTVIGLVPGPLLELCSVVAAALWGP